MVVGISIDATDDTIAFSRGGGISFSTGTFNGWSFFDINDTMADIIGAELVSTTVGLTNARITFDANTVWVNFVNLSNLDNFESTIRLTFANVNGVPEPSSLALTGLALGVFAAGALGRRRRL